MAHQIQIKELINGIEITENLDGVIVVKLLSYNSRPFFRTTNETDEESYQVLDRVGEIYHLPALATEFVLIDLNDTVYIPADGAELIEYSVKLRPFRPENDIDKVLSLGVIETTANSVKINLPTDSTNSVLISGSIYETYYPSVFNFVPVVEYQKILIIYAKPDAQVFYLAQGIEALEAVEPNYDGLFVARIIVDTSGSVIELDGNPGDVLVKTEEGQEWSPRLTEAEQGISSALSTLNGVQEELADIEQNKANKDASEMSSANIISWQEALDITTDLSPYATNTALAAEAATRLANDNAETTARQNADIAEANARTFNDGLLTTAVATKLDKPPAPDNIAERVINADGSTSPKGNFSRTLQVEVPLPATILEDWRGKIIVFTASGTLTAPASLSDSFEFEGVTLAGVTATPAITSPKTWLFGTPTAIPEKTIFTFMQRGNTNSLLILGL